MKTIKEVFQGIAVLITLAVFAVVIWLVVMMGYDTISRLTRTPTPAPAEFSVKPEFMVGPPDIFDIASTDAFIITDGNGKRVALPGPLVIQRGSAAARGGPVCVQDLRGNWYTFNENLTIYDNKPHCPSE